MVKSKVTRRLVARLVYALSAAVALCATTGLHAKQLAYYAKLGSGDSAGLLIDWRSAGRARVINAQGAVNGTVSGDVAQRVIALDTPFQSITYSAEFDDCYGSQVLQRIDTTHYIVRDVTGLPDRGTSQVATLGTITTLEGCDAGKVESTGSLTDSGTTLNRLALSRRPSVADLVPGTRIAGFSAEPPDAGVFAFRPADIVTLFGDGTASFAASGQVVPATLTAGRWLVFDFGSFERAYTRLEVKSGTGAELWMQADWAAGRPLRVSVLLAVKPEPGATFGSARQASRMWESGMFSSTQHPFFCYLYPNGTGELVNKDLVTGSDSRFPLRWAFDGTNIVQTRSSSFGPSRQRTWVPLRNLGSTIRFVMESDVLIQDGVVIETVLPQRVNFYVNTGTAVPPTITAAAAPTADLRRPTAWRARSAQRGGSALLR